jgi:pyridinium-3,5-bisthiocarboxylic acid mononucleotide nickel chelatase
VLRTGDGTVKAAHGILPVPAPATLMLLQGHAMSPGPVGSGELVTPTGAALVRVLSRGAPPEVYTPVRTGFGAGTKEFPDRANALRIVLADVDVGASSGRTRLVQLACDIDDMSPEYVAALAERARTEGALDVVLIPVTMKKGRAGTRVEVLCAAEAADQLETLLLTDTSTIGVRRSEVSRLALPRRTVSVDVLGDVIRVKIVTLPDGSARAKPEFDDVQRVALATHRRPADIYQLALAATERL